jgi:hypothetical protein
MNGTPRWTPDRRRRSMHARVGQITVDFEQTIDHLIAVLDLWKSQAR